MIARFLKFKKVINEITADPDSIDGIRKNTIKRLKKCNISNAEWGLIKSLETILQPFYAATLIVSGQQYSTLSFCNVIFDG